MTRAWLASCPSKPPLTCVCLQALTQLVCHRDECFHSGWRVKLLIWCCSGTQLFIDIPMLSHIHCLLPKQLIHSSLGQTQPNINGRNTISKFLFAFLHKPNCKTPLPRSRLKPTTLRSTAICQTSSELVKSFQKYAKLSNF